MRQYKNIMVNAGRIVLHYKSMWFMGLLLLLFGESKELDIIHTGAIKLQALPEGIQDIPVIMEPNGIVHTLLTRGKEFFTSSSKTDAALSFAALAALLVISFIIALWAQGSIIAAIGSLQKQKKIKLKDCFGKSASSLSSIILIHVLIKGVLYIAIGLMVVPLFFFFKSQHAIAGMNALSFAIFLIFTPLMLIASFLTKYAVSYLILRGRNVYESVEDAIFLFRQNWLVSCEFAVTLFLLSFLVGIGAYVFALLLSAPGLAIATTANDVLSPEAARAIVNSFTLGTFVVVGSILTAFIHSAWTILYLDISRKSKVSSIVSFFTKKKRFCCQTQISGGKSQKFLENLFAQPDEVVAENIKLK